MPAASFAQVWCQVYQEDMSSAQLLGNWTPWAALTLFALSPLTDRGFPDGVVSTMLFGNRERTAWLALSAGSAVAVNYSGHLVIGKLSAIGFQVLGCFKTVFIVTIGVLFFQDPFALQTVLGVSIALFGTTWYSRASNQEVCCLSTSTQRLLTVFLLFVAMLATFGDS